MHHIRILLCLAVVVTASGNARVFAQKFDESFDHWPVQLKINGTIIAGGGGELPQDVFRILMDSDDSMDTLPTIVHFRKTDDSPLLPPGKTPKLKKAQADTLIEQAVVLSPSNPDLSEDSVNQIENSQAIWIRVDQGIDPSRQPSFQAVLDASKRAVDNGGTLCLNGNLVNRLGSHVSNFSSTNMTIGIGSHLIPDAIIRSDYSDSSDRKGLLAVLAHQPRCVGIGIERNTAIVLRGRKIRVVGKGSATFCLMANQQKPVRIQRVKQSASRRPNPYTSIIDLTAWRRDAIDRTLAPFPAERPRPPVVRNGTLFIVGGGGMPRGLMKQMVELAGGKDARMVYIPCSERDEIKVPQSIVQTWKKMGVKSATFLHSKNRIQTNTDDEFLAPLKNATGIWLGGGRQWNFSDSYYGTQAHKLMKEVLERGGVIGGSSAGASVQGRYMCRANPVANFDIMAPGYERGLGFLDGVAIDQHFSQRGRQKDMTQLVNRYPQLLGIGLDEGTAIIVNQSKAQVVGKGKVFFYDRGQPVIPGTDDFMALGSGMKFDLAKRKVIPETPDDDSQ